MATRMSLAILAMAAMTAAFFHNTAAQTEYVVGNELGWLVPPGGPAAYYGWAYNKTFIVGDILVFNFVNGTQDVAIVTKEEYDDCDSTFDAEDVIALYKTSPAKILLNTTGTYYFTSTYQNHCALGQKLTINVSIPAPPPPPHAAPPPPPPRGPLTYTVGDNLTWVVPPGGPLAYIAWAYNKSFVVGDTLVFEFVNDKQDVAIVNKDGFIYCNTSAVNIIAVYKTSPAKILLNTTGEHFFTSTYENHCFLGQKLAINVTAATTPPSPSPSSNAPPSTTTPSAPGPSASGPSSLHSSAPSRIAGGFFLAFCSIIVAFV